MLKFVNHEKEVTGVNKFNWPFLLLAAALAASPALAKERAKPELRNYTVPGNLESPHDLGCISINEAAPEYNPVDLYRAAKTCLASERYEDAFKLIRLAGVYGRFDMARVTDVTAHQAVTVARMEVFEDTSEPVRLKFSEFAKTHGDDVQETAAFCGDLRRLGPPTYMPEYMVKHGMMAFLRRDGNGTAKDFDRDKAWTDLLSTYAKCSE